MPRNMETTTAIGKYHIVWIAALLITASLAAFIFSDRYFTVVEDETTIIDGARRPVAATLRIFWSGRGQFLHPPLSDVLLHFWIPVAGNSVTLLRAPSVVLFLSGLLILASAARKLAGDRAFLPVIAIGTLSPFAFHFARLAGWYAFSFFAVAALTLAWLRYLERSTAPRLIAFILLAIAAIYANYYGWVLVACLLLDGWLLRRRDALKVSVVTFGAMAVAYIPLWRPFLRASLPGRQSGAVLSKLVLAAYNLYILFVSESVAPWIWWFSLPAAAAIALVLWIAWQALTPRIRLFLLYFAIAFTGLAVTGKIDSKRLLFISGWLMLALAAALARRGRVLIAPLALVALLGWAGIFARKWYAAPHLIEPWNEVAHHAAQSLRQGDLVVSNSPSFHFYLGYLLTPREESRVFTVGQWRHAAPPRPFALLFVEGVNQSVNVPTGQLMRELQSGCVTLEARHLVPDSGSELKRRLFPQFREPPFRISVYRFRCD
jgi:hypothetical protein